MTPLADLAADWPEISRLLDEALARPATEREAWLAAQPSLSVLVRQIVQRLLTQQAALETASFLATLPPLQAAPPPGPDGPAGGDLVGPWQLIRELGQGGMGSVWLADRADGRFRRQVALKLPRLTWARGLAERMARERDILATLEHPHIARMYDAGVDDLGRPWLALEYVPGRAIDAHCCDEALPVARRVEVLLQVCAAVAYAHNRLVIHRDLKPGNILVDDTGQVRLLDFGIAKLMADEQVAETALTLVAGRALTLDYASPEQVRGEPLGVATDVYSLGVVAFELLAGVRPHRRQRESLAALEEAVLTQDAPLASRVAVDPAVARVLRGDLDAILNQALKKSVDERYRSVEALAEDLRRWLNDEPVAARHDGAAYRLRKFVRRHRLQVSTAAVVTVALLGATGVSLWQAQRAETARALAEQEAATARAVQGFLESVFQSNRGDQALPADGRQATARDLLDSGARRITGELKDQPAARLRLLEVLAGLYEDMGELDRMRELSEQRLAQVEGIPAAQRSRERVRALTDLAHALAISGREVDARGRLDEAEALLQRTRPDDLTLRIRLLVRRGSVHRADDPARAASAAEQALALAGPLPPSVDSVLAAYLVGEARVQHGDAKNAVPVIRDAVALVERQPELGASILAPLHALLGDAEFALGQLGDAEASYRRGIAVERARGGSGVLPHLLTQQLGQFLVRQERWREALDLMAPTWAWARGQKVDYDTTVPMASVVHGQALIGIGRLSEGIAALDLAVEQVARLQDAADIAPRIEAVRASAWVRVGRMADTEKVLTRLDADLAAARRPMLQEAEQARRELQLARGRVEEALAGWRAERTAAGMPLVPDARSEPVARLETARLLLASGQTEAALDNAAAVIAAFDARPAVGAASRGATPARAWQLKGEAALALGRHRDALEALERAVALLRPEVDASLSPDLARTLALLADAAQRAGQSQRASMARRESDAIRSAARRG